MKSVAISSPFGPIKSASRFSFSSLWEEFWRSATSKVQLVQTCSRCFLGKKRQSNCCNVEECFGVLLSLLALKKRLEVFRSVSEGWSLWCLDLLINLVGEFILCRGVTERKKEPYSTMNGFEYHLSRNSFSLFRAPGKAKLFSSLANSVNISMTKGTLCTIPD